MQFSSRICKWFAISLALLILANAQTSSPTQTWNIAAATGGTTNNVGCTLGLANPADPNGYYDDPFGARYAIRCQQDSSGIVYDQAGTTNQGVYGCSKGCDNRPNCKGWSYVGYQTSARSTLRIGERRRVNLSSQLELPGLADATSEWTLASSPPTPAFTPVRNFSAMVHLDFRARTITAPPSSTAKAIRGWFAVGSISRPPTQDHRCMEART